MTYTTATSISVNLSLPAGTDTSYTTFSVSLYVTYKGTIRRWNPTSVTNSTEETSGSIIFNGIAIPDNGTYVLEIKEENNLDLDTGGVTISRLNPIARKVIRKVTSSSIIAI